MRLSLEFENVEKFFTELPLFAEAIGHAAEHVTFTHKDKPTTVPVLSKTDNPATGAETAENEPEKPKAKKSTPKKEEPQNEAVAEPKKAVPEGDTKLTENDVRKVLNNLIKISDEGKERVREILIAHEADKLPALKPEHYAAVIAEATDAVNAIKAKKKEGEE